ncbi:hypothetical protein ACFVP3_39590 [Streptomyces sp. NPDC057806]|uniref:hypothetical protein n=1 Tax=Streptomyces sp. NPDC057806 TaxID=3346255 RepID=UPI0036B3573E
MSLVRILEHPCHPVLQLGFREQDVGQFRERGVRVLARQHQDSGQSAIEYCYSPRLDEFSQMPPEQSDCVKRVLIHHTYIAHRRRLDIALP